MAARVSTSQRGSFERTVTAIVDSIVRDRVRGDSGRVPDVAHFVLAQHRRMPAHLRAGVRAATLVLALDAVLRTGRLFHAAPVEARDARLARWRQAAFPPCRDLVRFWESLVVHAWFSEPERHAS